MYRVGNLFEKGTAAGVPVGVTPLPGSAKDPIILTCQSNYHILFTDGFTNQAVLPIGAGNKDLTIPTYGNLWRLPADHTLRIELTNIDSPYITPSRVPSATTVSNI